MGYELQADESLAYGLQRIIQEQIDHAPANLENPGDDARKAVHEARKSFKKIRAALRLVRDEVGREVFRRENACYRDAGRALSDVRDSHVRVLTVDRLARHYAERLDAEAYWEIVEARTAYRVRFVQSLEAGGFDALLCPPAAIPAATHGSTKQLFPAMTYGLVFNVIGAPAGVVAATTVQPGEESDRPVGRDLAEITAREVEEGSAGLPVGVQVVSRHWREDVALTVMAALESHFRKQPGYPALPA